VTLVSGGLSIALGIAMLVWPGATLLVAIGLLALQLIVAGVVQVGLALGADQISGGDKALVVIGGALSILIGVLILRKPLQSLVVVALLVGAAWLVRGVADAVTAIPGGRANRGWSFALGLVSAVAGVYVLLNPEISLSVFVTVAGIWMIARGLILVAAVVVAGRSAPVLVEQNA
jgi:uncharacterized membrane protein HdeD (DUF308 family)